MTENKSQHVPVPDSTRFETDTQKIVRKHLEDKEHVITEDDLRNVRVGMTPPTGQQQLDKVISEKIKSGAEEEPNEKPADDPITPWDTIVH